MFSEKINSWAICDGLRRLVRLARQNEQESIGNFDWRQSVAMGEIRRFELGDWKPHLLDQAMESLAPSRFSFMDNGLLIYQRASDGPDVVAAIMRLLKAYAHLLKSASA